ncbi:MAG: hypothetical protein ACFE96_14260 [Candidatus Hermodarchaeota archaeon]
MKKKINKILLTIFTILIFVTIISSINVAAVEPPDQTVNVQGDAIQTQLKSNNRTMFCFRERTRLTICANIGMELDINCEALRIGEKDVIIEIKGEGDLRMIMTCTREENQLGLMNGSLHRVRNRNSYRYLEGFCISMDCTPDCKCKCDPDCTCTCECECKCDPECTCPCDCECKCESDCNCECDCQCKCDPVCDCECDCQCKCDQECKCDTECPYDGTFLKARLRIRETNQNRLGQWAYYDNGNQEWVTVTTINQDGYISTETNILSTWTLLVPEKMTSVIVNTTVIATVSVIGIIAISVFYFKKKR